jgi:multidrug efflux pump
VNISRLFIERPVATTLLTFGIALAGSLAFFLLPVSPLPQVDFPTISVQATLPGASPETVATSVATPLERHLGQIADVTEMTSQSSVGSARITLQFGLNRDIDGAARDVQAAINAARADLPASLKSNPTYRKINPADAPVMILALTSQTMSTGQMYDAASTVLEQKLSQIKGIGQVLVGGSSLPAVRAELNPRALFKYGIGLEDVRAALSSANANAPKGEVDANGKRYQIYTNDQARQASQFADLLVAYRNGAGVRLRDVAEVTDSVENIRNEGLANGKPAVLVILFRQPGANIIDTIDAVQAELPVLKNAIPPSVDVTVAMDQSTTIRTTLRDVERTLIIAVALVILVVFLFLRNGTATLIPVVAVPISLLGTFGAMYLLGFSLNNLSLMAMIVGTGFVVDDAIVVLENISRHIEEGMPRMQATLQGTREVGFTVLSMSISLVAVFIPILLMGGIIGRLFREFALTLSLAIMISLVVSLTTIPMMCSRLLRHKPESEQSRFSQFMGRLFKKSEKGYENSLHTALDHPRLMMLLLFAVIGLNIYLLAVVPKGFLPQQDIGKLMGNAQADQSISFQSMKTKMEAFIGIVGKDPAVQNVVGFTGGGSTNTGQVFVSLKPLAERKIAADQVIARLRKKTSSISGATLFLQAAQDIRVGGRASNAQYQYTLQADNLDDLRIWAPKINDAMLHLPQLTDVSSDQQEKGLETKLIIDRATAARLHLTASQIDNTLYDAFGQRQVSTIYNTLNQYHVIMEVAPQYWQNPETLNDLYVSTSGGAVTGTQATNAVAGTSTGTAKATPTNATTAANVAGDSARNLNSNSIAATGKGGSSTGSAISSRVETMVPLSAFSHFGPGTTALSVNHQGLFAATTISFNLAPNISLGTATDAINAAVQQLNPPTSVHGSFQGTAKTYQDSLSNEPILILSALLAVYIVLGVLYESYAHPITILSTLPSAGVGAVLALMLFKTDFSIIALIGVLLLIGIVKKNAIMMIDVAIDAERNQGMSAHDAIFHACILRFRPIMMTTMVALLSALPLALGTGEGAELRRPLGISIVGGLIVSQALTLYTTPVVYLYIDRLQQFFVRHRSKNLPRLQEENA